MDAPMRPPPTIVIMIYSRAAKSPRNPETFWRRLRQIVASQNV
jgi:hypothetical protein